MFDSAIDSQQINKVFPDYKFERYLGQGAFGKVFLATSRITNERFAVKKINCFGMSEYERSNAINQVRILASIDHKNIIKFKAGMFDNNEEQLYLFMEFASEGDLTTLFDSRQECLDYISQHTIWNILLQLATGLQYLHRHHIIHRDIKPANIFRCQHLYKLADMNVSKIMEQGKLATTKTGSPYYVSPEVWQGKGYDQKCDIWSLGIVAYQLCCQRVPYETNSIDELFRLQKSEKIGNIPYFYSSDLNSLIHSMLEYQPKMRFTAEKVKQACLNHLNLERPEKNSQSAALLDTIVLPEGQQRWINLVPKPPKSKQKIKSTLSKKQSRLQLDQVQLPIKLKIFTSLDHKRMLMPRSSNSAEKGPRKIRLPLIPSKYRKQQSKSKITTKSRKNSYQQQRKESQGKSLEASTRAQTPQRIHLTSEKINRQNKVLS